MKSHWAYSSFLGLTRASKTTQGWWKILIEWYLSDLVGWNVTPFFEVRYLYIYVYMGVLGARKIHCCFAWKKEKKLTARLKSASPRAKQTYNQRKDDKEHFAMFQTYMIDLNSFTSFTKQTKSHQLPQSTFFLTKHPNLQVNRRVKNLPSPNRV